MNKLIKYSIRVIAPFLFVTIFSCNKNKSLNQSLEIAGENREQILRVIQYYKNDPEKLDAVYFLISNMKNKHSLVGDDIENFDSVFFILDSLHKNKIKIPVISPIFQAKWDSIVYLHGFPMKYGIEKSYDLQSLKAEYLIENIDAAFKEWKTNNLLKGLTFNQFCEYILPHRIKTERIENWRGELKNQYKSFRDTVNASSRLELAKKLNLELKNLIYLNHTLRAYPFAMKASQMNLAKRGACTHLVAFTAAVMRANGIPVGIDHAPRWGDLDKGHEWNVLLMEDESNFPFEAASGVFGSSKKGPYRYAKVFRQQYKENNFLDNGEIPPSLTKRLEELDVTHEYTKTFDIFLPLANSINKKNKYAVISTFGKNTWEPQYFGNINTGKAEFKNMGSNLIYIAMYYNKGFYSVASLPFIIKENGSYQFLKPNYSKKITLTLERKYPYLGMNTIRAKELIGGKFQGANKPDFTDATTLFTINKIPVKYEEELVNLNKRFKYVRYLSAEKHRANIAELEFIVDGGEIAAGKIIGFPEVSKETGTIYQNAFDKDLKSYFSADTVETSWVGLEFKIPRKIEKIRYCPRSDTNFIIKGDLYELRYWSGKKWVSLGKQIATQQYLEFKDIPSNAVYILKNLTEGNEERIFTYERGKQVWW